MKKISIILVAISVIGLWSCNTTETATETVKEDITKEQLAQTLDSLEAEMVFAWDTMISSDDEKYSSIKRLIEEVSYMEKSNEDSVKMLQTLFDETKKLRYTRENITSESIDNYDIAQEKLINKVFAYAASVPGVESYPIVTDLKNEISALDGQVVSFRANYDNYSIPYNETLLKYPNTLKELDAKYSTLKPLGVFTISEEAI